MVSLGLILAAVHPEDLGAKGWLAAGKWTAGLPPISLLAVITALVPLLFKSRSMR